MPDKVALPTEHAAVALGFRLEGRMRQAAMYDGQYHDFLIYGLLREDFLVKGGHNGRRT